MNILPERLLMRSLTAIDKDRLTRNDRRLTDRKNESGIGANRGVSGALRSGKKKFFTANIFCFSFFSNIFIYTYICKYFDQFYLTI